MHHWDLKCASSSFHSPLLGPSCPSCPVSKLCKGLRLPSARLPPSLTVGNQSSEQQLESEKRGRGRGQRHRQGPTDQRFAYPALFAASLHSDKRALMYLRFRIKCGQFFRGPVSKFLSGLTDHVPKNDPWFLPETTKLCW